MTGFIRVAALTPNLQLAHPQANAQALLSLACAAHAQGASVAVAPELSLTGATCGDLFLSQALLQHARNALTTLCNALPENLLFICGLPLSVDDRLYDCAVVLTRNRILGYVPRARLPRAETRLRTFAPAHTLTRQTLPDGTPIGTDLVFELDSLRVAVTFDTATPPAASAQLLLCLAAAPEGVGQASLRRNALEQLSRATASACVYAAAGEGESSTDGIYSGHRMLVSEGKLRAEARWDSGISCMDFAPEWVTARRLRTGCARKDAAATRTIPVTLALRESDASLAGLRKNPFIPEDIGERRTRCAEILHLQVRSLHRRMTHVHAKRLVLGLSGGLDSTLALVVCAALCRQAHLPATTVLAVTMPGFGTSSRTYRNAVTLANVLGVELREISIVPTVSQHFNDIGQDPAVQDVTYENAQARARTYLLMDLANKEQGLLVGTGDLSEIALGWSTYNGDHMSMYSVNCGVPKTLIPHCLEAAIDLLSAEADTAAGALSTVLKDICDTPVSPELVPGVQHTETIVGRYELHDCFLWYFMRYGCDRARLAELAALLHGALPEDERTRTLDIFCRRVIAQQFKRSCSPDGPAIGGISLSPRGGWMLPSDATLTL